MTYNTARPYLAVFMIMRQNGKIACVLRSNTDWMDGFYGLPAGKAEVGERAQLAAIREAKEEVGVDILEKNIKFVHACHRRADDDTLAWLDILFETDTWQGEPHNAETHKHSELAWLDPQNMPQNTIPALKHFLDQIEAGNMYSEYGWEA